MKKGGVLLLLPFLEEKMMKKIILRVIMGLTLIILGSGIANADNVSYTSAQQYSEKEIPQPEETITQQQIDQYNKNVSNTIPIDGVTVDAFVKSGKTAVIYVGFAECPHCENFAPILNKFINDTGVPVYYLNMDNLGQINSDFIGDMQKFQINATPTVFLLKHGKVIHKYVGDNITEQRLLTLTKYHY